MRLADLIININMGLIININMGVPPPVQQTTNCRSNRLKGCCIRCCQNVDVFLESCYWYSMTLSRTFPSAFPAADHAVCTASVVPDGACFVSLCSYVELQEERPTLCDWSLSRDYPAQRI